MRLGFYMGYAQPGTSPLELVELAREAERLGYDSAWAAEAWGTDAVSVLAWLAAVTTKIKIGSAILQIPARTPANTAMTAATLDLLSNGRFLLGLGTSGPQVVEGWHGEPWGKPLAKTREYVEIVRAVLRRDVIEHHGENYDIPYSQDGATGLGKPLKLMARPLRADMPIYLASLRRKSVELAAEIADGWLPIFFSPKRFSVYRSALEAGFKKAGDGKGLKTFDVAPSVTVVQGDDVKACLGFVKPVLALYVGGMGARGKNFYNDLARRYGFEAAAKQIQDLYLDGKKNEAIAAVPDELADEVTLCGPKERIRDRLAEWKESGITTMILALQQPEALRTVAEAVL
jgi:F420-dependent oxidoreductase-like protein